MQSGLSELQARTLPHGDKAAMPEPSLDPVRPGGVLGLSDINIPAFFWDLESPQS